MMLRNRLARGPLRAEAAIHEPGAYAHAFADQTRHRVVTIRASAHSPLPAQRVLEAARDLSPRRAGVWPNVWKRRITVHHSGATFADVTEGTWVVGLFGERNHYDWSQPGTVKATVIDSSIFEPGSTFELRATDRDGGSDLHLVLTVPSAVRSRAGSPAPSTTLSDPGSGDGS